MQDSSVFDIPSLERKWLKYKIKKYLPYTVATLLGVIALIATASFVNSDNSTLADNNQTLIVDNTPKSDSAPTNSLSEVAIEPSMQFMQTITPATIEPKVALVQSQTLPSKQVIPPPAPIATPQVPVISVKAPTIKHGSNAIDIYEIEERFKTNPSPQLGLYLARYYYDHKDYNEAYNYALKTNSLNKEIEESWLIFSKSLIKLGKVDQAKKTLQYYISQSNSDNAKELLSSIEQGAVK